MTEKKIREHIKELNKQERYSDIAELIVNLDEKHQTPRVLCDLAYAYTNMAIMNRSEPDAGMLQKALSLFASIENRLPKDDWTVNFRTAYTLFLLDCAGEALERFQKSYAKMPGDEGIERFIEMCYDRVTLPIFKKPFAERMTEGWKKFAAGEGALRRMISEHADMDEIISYSHDLLSGTFDNAYFEVGYNGEKFDLILSPEGDKYMLFLFDAFKMRVPESVTKHWNILLGRQPMASPEKCELGFLEKRVAPSDVIVKTERSEDGFKVIGYCEKLAPLLAENHGNAIWLFNLLLDMTLGEIVNMRYVDEIDLSEEPFDGSPLIKLPEEMKRLFGDKEGWEGAESYLDCVSGYEMKPREFAEDERPTPRLDGFFGFSAIPQLMFEYLDGDHRTINKADNDGVAAGFIFFPVYVFAGDENANFGKAITDFRKELERYICDKAGDFCVFLGGCTGVDNCYLDFLAWDIRPVLDAAAEFFANQNTVPWAFYQSFRSDVKVIGLMDEEEDEDRHG